MVGWSLNHKGKLAPTVVDLKATQDKSALASRAARLNLELMRWRALPDLDTALLESTSCLLIGAGTLGCYVSRCLLAWGVRNITFIDGGVVSMSNPVRQSLFEFEDSGKPKAECAAERLQRILPSVMSKGVR